MMRKIIFILIVFFGISTLVFAKDIGFEVTVDRNKVSLGSRLQLNLTFSGTQDISRPQLPEIDGFEARYLGPSTSMSIINGKAESSITHRYVLIPFKVGTFEIGPFSFQYKGEVLTSKPITVKVAEGLTKEKQGGEGLRDRESELEDYVFLVMEPGKTGAYVNEVIPLRIKLYINTFTLRDIDYPAFGHKGFAVNEFDRPLQYAEMVEGVSYDVIEFNTSLFGTRPGEFSLGPAEIKSNLLVRKQKRRRPRSLFDDFFGRYETYPLTLKAPEATITILPLPGQGKPAGFEGALGKFQFSMQAEPKEVGVGDPITLRMTISGKGNFDTVSSPKLGDKEGFKLYEPEVKIGENEKVFEQVLIPKHEKIKEIPEIGFSYFDPARGKYKTISQGPIPISVTRLKEEEGLKIVELPSAAREMRSEVLGRDIIYIKESLGNLRPKAGFLYKNKGFLYMPLLPLLMLVSVFLLHQRREKLRRDTRYARLLRAPKRAKKGLLEARGLLEQARKDEFYDSLFKTLQEYLGDKFHLSPGGITVHIVEQVLRPLGINEAILKKLEGVFEEFDRVRFAPSLLTDENMHEALKQVEEIIDYLERVKV